MNHADECAVTLGYSEPCNCGATARPQPDATLDVRALVDIIRRARPHIAMASSITSGREFREMVKKLLVDIDASLDAASQPDATGAEVREALSFLRAFRADSPIVQATFDRHAAAVSRLQADHTRLVEAARLAALTAAGRERDLTRLAARLAEIAAAWARAFPQDQIAKAALAAWDAWPEYGTALGGGQ